MSVSHFAKHVCLVILILGFGCIGFMNMVLADDPPAVKSNLQPWTFEEAVDRLVLSPRDPYLQFVVLQLGRRAGKEQEAIHVIERPNLRGGSRLFGGDSGRRSQADLFSTFSGALAIQESLQLDTMRGDADTNPQERVRLRDQLSPFGKQKLKASVPIAKLNGPTMPSHPWEKMLEGKKPDVGSLAGLVPEEFYFAEFKSVTKLHEILGMGGLWGGHIFTQALGDSRSQLTADRVKTQLGITGIPPEMLEKMGVEAVGIAGNDPFVAEGSDVTLLVKGRNIASLVKLTQLGAGQSTPGEHVGISYGYRTSPDGTVNVYSANPKPDLHVRGNSLPAFKRVLETIAGKTADGKPVNRLGESAEFQYVRTRMPTGAAEEDGLIYLSDSFIRRLVGPQLKITERRRVIVYTHLRMIGHAALLFRNENGRAPHSLQELADSKCAPGIFGKGKLAHPDGGKYTLSADGMSGVCSKYGQAGSLTPNIERLVTEATGNEAEEYRNFVAEYSQYWRTFFDPIAIRVKVSDKQLRLETLVLPLIDNSIYTDLARGAGKPEPMDLLPTPKHEIGGVWIHFDKKPILDVLGPEQPEKKVDPVQKAAGKKTSIDVRNDLRQIALGMHNYESVTNEFPTTNIRDKNKKPLLSWRVAILPYIEQDELYRQFKLDEPWDSEHNKALIEKMPRRYSGNDEKKNAEGKTSYVVPSGKNTLSPPDGKKQRFTNITDGTSNTILAVVANTDNAVIWTKPDDFPFDPNDPLKGLVRPGEEWIEVAMADGSLKRISAQIDPKKFAAMITPAGGEVIELTAADEQQSPRQRAGGSLFGEFLPPLRDIQFLEHYGFDLNKLRRFLKDGIGNQIGFHVHDAPRLFDAEFTGFGGGTASEIGFGSLGMALKYVFGPSSLSIPVKDAKIVNEYLDELDRVFLSNRNGISSLGVSWRREVDFYTFKHAQGHKIRCAVLNLVGLKWRLYWAQIGDGLYIVTRPFILDDIVAANQTGKRPEKTDPAHAVLRIRPENWNAVLPGYSLGWAEGHRAACHANLDMIANVSRGWNERSVGATDTGLLNRVARVYGTRPYCPDNGLYKLTDDNRSCRCSVHGGHEDPQQPSSPTAVSATGQLLKTFSGLTATVRFEEDGLRVVLTVDRKK